MMKCLLQSVVVLFQEDVLKLLGNILEETYGLLCNSETVNGTIHSTCSVSEPSAVDAANPAGSCTLLNSSSQLCELAVANVTNTPTVIQEPLAEVSVSCGQPLNPCDVNVHPSAATSFLLSEPSDLMSDIGSHPSDIARAWSAGTLVTDSSGKSVEVNTMQISFLCVFHFN